MIHPLQPLRNSKTFAHPPVIQDFNEKLYKSVVVSSRWRRSEST